jgi:hypothetical protein
MTEAMKIAKLYFELSNKSDFDGIMKLLTDSTTYSSQRTGVYLGRDSIIAMQKEFHGKFSELNWKINSVKEIKPGIILFDYEFTATTKDGEPLKNSGQEYVIVYQGKIQHIEIRAGA